MQFYFGPAVHFLSGVDMADETPLEIAVALHVGTVPYGNTGATDRLDFTVIGPAVNLVNRIEGMAHGSSCEPDAMAAELIGC
jgi:class 3 adenylate cyclase